MAKLVNVGKTALNIAGQTLAVGGNIHVPPTALKDRSVQDSVQKGKVVVVDNDLKAGQSRARG